MPKKLRVANLEPQGYSTKAREIIESFAKYKELPPEDTHDVYITRLSPISATYLSTIRPIKAIVTATTGLDHIDLDYCKEAGIDVLSLQGETEFLQDVHATAEHTFALMLALLRKIPQAAEHTKAGQWDRYQFIGNELHGKILGIIGYGRVGRQVARMASGFGMYVNVTDPKGPPKKPPFLCFSFFEDMRDLLMDADIISLHVPLTDETRGLIGAEQMNQMCDAPWREWRNFKPILINTSRGEVIDQDALLKGLDDRRLGGAAIDVLQNEGTDNMKSTIHMSWRRNLIITPHIAGATHESMEKTEIFMAEKLKKWAEERGYA